MPWLPPAIVAHWGIGSPLASLLIVAALWLVLPLAVAASWTGSLLGRLAHTLTLRRAPRPSTLRPGRPRVARLVPGIALGVTLAVLLAVNGWSLAPAAQLHPAPAAQLHPAPAAQLHPAPAAQLHPAPAVPVSVQIARAQATLPFTIRQPAYLPDGLTLTRVIPTKAICGPSCSVNLEYQDAQGHWLTIGEAPAGTFARPPLAPLPAPPDFLVSDSTGSSIHPIWWLGADVQPIHEINLAWTADGLDYLLGSNGAWPADTLKQVAASL